MKAMGKRMRSIEFENFGGLTVFNRGSRRDNERTEVC
jgi:hypothetical protein